MAVISDNMDLDNQEFSVSIHISDLVNHKNNFKVKAGICKHFLYDTVPHLISITYRYYYVLTQH